jgi:acyl-CoA synthetase (AMP-forming)/AMP-acid ligase II
MKVIDAEDGSEQPRDGVSSGRLLVKGNWTCKSYYRLEEPAVDSHGWFDTGDMATITHDGYLQITDRAKVRGVWSVLVLLGFVRGTMLGRINSLSARGWECVVWARLRC